MSALTVVVIIVSVVGGLAVVITPFVWALLRRRDAMRGVADGLGLRFWAGLWKRPGASPVEVPVDLGRRQRVVMAMWGHWHGLDVAVCDVAFDTAGVSGPQGAGISGGKSITVAEAKLHAWLPETWVKPRGALSFRKGLETGSSDFDQAFQVESADAEFARAVLDPPMRQTLLQAPGGMRYWWGESYAMVLPHHRLHPKDIEKDLLPVLEAFVGRITPDIEAKYRHPPR